MTSILQGEAEYRPHPAVSQSEIQLLANHPHIFYAKRYGAGAQGISSSGFYFGSLLDCMITEPDQFPYRYTKRPDDLPAPTTDLEKAFCDAIRAGKDRMEAQTYAGYKKAGEKQGDTLYNKFERYFEYADGLDGRTEYTSEDEYRLNKCMAALKGHPVVNKLLFDNKLDRSSQVAILFNLGGVDCKALLDFIVVNEAKKTIYFIDLKTTGKSIAEFPKWYRVYRYDFQQMWYWLGAKRALTDGLFPSINFLFNQDLSGYKIINLCIAVESTGSHMCRVFEPTEKMQTVALNDVKQMIGLYNWHHETKLWEITREEYDNDMILPIDTYRS